MKCKEAPGVSVTAIILNDPRVAFSVGGGGLKLN